VLFETGGDPIVAAGPTSHVGDVLRRAGGTNVMADQRDPWARVPWEVVLQRNPDVILMTHDRGAELRRAGWRSLAAVRNGRVHRVPRSAFHHASPRLADGLELAARLFHGPR
jgi:iron complex transport system substrate-binding protein